MARESQTGTGGYDVSFRLFSFFSHSNGRVFDGNVSKKSDKLFFAVSLCTSKKFALHCTVLYMYTVSTYTGLVLRAQLHKSYGIDVESHHASYFNHLRYMYIHCHIH